MIPACIMARYSSRPIDRGKEKKEKKGIPNVVGNEDGIIILL